jgi:hypothetical protein
MLFDTIKAENNRIHAGKIRVSSNTAPRGGCRGKTPSMLRGLLRETGLLLDACKVETIIFTVIIVRAERARRRAEARAQRNTAASSTRTTEGDSSKHAQNDKRNTTGEKKERQKQERRAEGQKSSRPHTPTRNTTDGNSKQQLQKQTKQSNNNNST